MIVSLILFACSPLEEYEIKNEAIEKFEKNTVLKKQFSLNNWMQNLPDNKYITQVSIPGTHDSGARYDPLGGPFTENTAKTQNLTIDQQLNIGIRYLDIRCKIAGESFAIHHGIVYQNLMFGDVINSINNFLTNNPSEFILLSIKKEDNNDSSSKFEEILQNYITNNLDNFLYHGSNTAFPKIQDIRGKIIMIKRFSGLPIIGYDANSNWIDNYKGSFIINKSTYSFKIQDYYNVDKIDNKWSFIENQLENAKASQSTSQLYLNFLSGIKKNFLGIPNTKAISNYTNPKLIQYLNTLQSGNYGICIFDFVDDTHTKSVINSNF